MQRYNIFNKYNKICILNDESFESSNETCGVIKCTPESVNSIDFSAFFDDNSRQDIIIIVKNITTEEVFSKAIKKLKFVQAAGGLVKNEEDEFLFIYRAKHWDLPKGHRETGENLDFTALREVEEETGIENIELKDYLGTTYHTYILNGKREIKETHWYSMSAKKTSKLVPQKEEGIQKAEWLTKEKIESQAKKIYPSIQDLLIRIGFCFNQTL